MEREIHVEIAGTSVGGCNYAIRIMKKIKHYGHCNVMIGLGPEQDIVHKKVLEQIDLVNEVAKTNLFVNVFKEGY